VVRQELEKRKAKRLNYRDTIMFIDEYSHYYCYAQVKNVSGDGMYFESESSLEPGNKIGIHFDNPPFRSAPKKYRATVRWCEILPDDDEFERTFGVGVKYI
jgi:hypothetical protein